MLSDIEIAQNAKMKHIRDVAASIGIAEDDLEFYGKYKAKIASELWGKVKDNENGKLILVTAINPTPAGEDHLNDNNRTWRRTYQYGQKVRFGTS